MHNEDDDLISTEDIFKFLEKMEGKKEVIPKISTQKSKENKDVLKFIQKNGIIPGNYRVPTYVIYYQYMKWTRTTWYSFWGKEEFFRTFKKHFKQVRTGKQRYYLLNDALDLSDEAEKKAKLYDEKKRRQSEKIKKIQDEVPSTRQE